MNLFRNESSSTVSGFQSQQVLTFLHTFYFLNFTGVALGRGNHVELLDSFYTNLDLENHGFIRRFYWNLCLDKTPGVSVNDANITLKLLTDLGEELLGEGESHIDFKAMIISLVLHLLLLLFEIFVCINLGGSHHFPWRLMFMPLYVLSSLSIVACIWGFRHERSVELETVFSVNVLQFVFLSLRLDKVILWSWVVVFVPMWIVLSLMCLLVLYYIIWSIIFVRTAEVLPAQRRGHVMVAIAAVLLVIPLLTFQIVLSNRLDGTTQDLFVGIVAPLQISLLSLLATSFYHKGGNHWWFGIRKDFCEFLLGTCTFLQEYGNISCKFSESVFSRPSGDETSIEPQRKPILHEYPAKCVVPVVSIEMPD
ncbi:Transmembrane protein 185B [Acropora cervicornis]|uniref:Transmembrane protein 185B n=2 Tax=Acropora TaxID=6127 RepID=A0AAD9Q0S2_ACRCE|nr:Transmembrane protein 185B [Acropora cervicornis]